MTEGTRGDCIPARCRARGPNIVRLMDETQEAINYLGDYVERLRAVNRADDLWNDLLPWQHKQHFQVSTPHGLRGQHVQRVISRQLQKMQREHSVEQFETWQRRWLRYDHLPTTAVGGFRGIVVVAANPGYAQKNNEREMAWRSTIDGNTAFCRDLFTKHAQHADGLGWWVRVTRFAHMAIEGVEAPNEVRTYPQLWKWADQGGVAGIDLIPFHSQSDELTGEVRSGRHRTGLSRSLYDVSHATLQMACRLQPKAILVVSRSGAFMAEDMAATIGMQANGELKVDFENPVSIDGKSWARAHSWTLHRYKVEHANGKKTVLYTMPGQLFSTRAMLQGMQLPLAKLIHKEI
jgi:hypothetical protein